MQLNHIIYALKLFFMLCCENGLMHMGFCLKLPYHFCPFPFQHIQGTLHSMTIILTLNKPFQALTLVIT